MYTKNPKIKLEHISNERCTQVYQDIYYANTLKRRLVGLLGSKSLEKNSGVMLEKCNQIHTIGMKFAIDVVYLSKENHVIKLVKGVVPNRFSSCLRAKRVIEFPAGFVARNQISLGDQLRRVSQ